MISPTALPIGLRCHALLIAAALVAGSGLTATAQDAPPAEQAPLHDDHAELPPAILDAPLPLADPAYLAPLEALVGDEEAYLDKMWALGNEEMDKIGGLLDELRQPMPADVAQLKRDELRRRTANLQGLCDISLKHFDHSASVHNFHGTVLYDVMGKQLDGAKEWHNAVSLDSDYSDPHNNLGMHYFHSGNYVLGFQHMDRALELDPKSADYCFNMAQNYLIYRPQTEQIRGWDNKKIYKEAMRLSKKATKLAPDDFEILQDYAVNFLAAENFELEPDWKEAAKAWVTAREHARNEVEVFYTWLNEGRAWRAMDNKKEARRCFQAALVVMPGNEITERLLNDMKAGS